MVVGVIVMLCVEEVSFTLYNSIMHESQPFYLISFLPTMHLIILTMG